MIQFRRNGQIKKRKLLGVCSQNEGNSYPNRITTPTFGNLSGLGLDICPLEDAEILTTKVGDGHDKSDFIGHAGLVEDNGIVTHIQGPGGALRITPRNNFIEKNKIFFPVIGIKRIP